MTLATFEHADVLPDVQRIIGQEAGKEVTPSDYLDDIFAQNHRGWATAAVRMEIHFGVDLERSKDTHNKTIEDIAADIAKAIRDTCEN